MSKLLLEVLADSNGLIKGLEKAQHAVNKFVQSAGGAGSAIGGKLNQSLSAFTSLAGGGAAAAGVLAGAVLAIGASATAMTIAAGKQAEELQQLSTMTGINTDKLQEYDVLMNRVGLGANDLTIMMKTLSQNMEAAKNGTGTAADRFRQLNIDIRKVTSTDDLIRKIATSLSGFANGTQKAAIEADLMGKGGLRLAVAMEGGAAGMDEAAAASTRLGASLSTGQLAELATMDDRIDDLTIAWKRFGQQIGSFVAPAIDFAAQALSNLLNMASQGLKGLNALGGVGDKPDTRQQPPALVDTAKLAAQAQALSDVRLRGLETFHHDSLAIAKSAFDQEIVLLDQQKAFGIKSAHEVATQRMNAIGRLDQFTVGSLQRQLSDFQQFVTQKVGLYADDEKGRSDLLKFQEESHTKELSMMNKIALAQQAATTNQMRAGLEVKTFWQQQLQDLVASNMFSVGLIVNTWTSGVANAIVTGGDFVKAAWQQTQIAVIQGGLNMAIQWGAQQALMVAQTAGTAAATTGIWAGATATISGFFAATGAAFTAVVANMVAILTAVGTFIMGVLSSIAAALTATVFGIPWAGAILVGIAAIAIALAATGNMGFKEGGIGDFGSGTPATLHGQEAIIPLNNRGASFMQDMLGMGGSDRQPIIQTHVMLNGRELATAMNEYQPLALRTMGVL
jgi:hypothetical protein